MNNHTKFGGIDSHEIAAFYGINSKNLSVYKYC